jgi:hypothetical protein
VNSAGTASGQLLHNLILFGRLLRGLGLDVNPGRMMDLVHALRFVEIGNKSDFYHTARSLLVHRHEDFPLFDQAFAMFWQKPLDGWTTLDLSLFGAQRRPRRPPVTAPPLREESAPPEENKNGSSRVNQPPVLQVTFTYSDREVLRHKDFADLTGDELKAIRQLMADLVWRLGERRTRRRKPGPGDFVDLRRTLRRNLKYGGDVLEWARREPKFKPRPLVILADVSGSMERYTRLLLHFLYGLAEGLDQVVETFLFSTRLTRITRQLRGRDVDQAMREVSRVVSDWSGGTRIGEALKAFNFGWGRRVLGRGAVALLISDGWDCGETSVLRQEMARLQRNCYRLIWLNPLLGTPGYEPLTRGMQTALPFVDEFRPIHNLASLEDLADHLARLDERRAARRQQTVMAHSEK